MFRLQNLPHKSFPGRQLNAASRKSLEIQASWAELLKAWLALTIG